MAVKKDFSISDLVWAKMKGFPFWPAKIVEPPTDKKSTPKKARHYVFFFGSLNYAWIKDENIVRHSEEMLQSTSSKKKSTLLKLAIKQIIEEAPKQAKSLVKENEYPKKSPKVLTSGTEKKIAKVQRKKVKKEIQEVRKRILPKRRCTDKSEYERTSPPLKLTKRPTEDFSELNTPPNLNYKCIAVSRLLDENPSSGITSSEFQPFPTFETESQKEIEEAPKQAKSLVKENESPEVLTSSTEEKIAKVKTESQEVRKRVLPKQRCTDKSEYERTSPPLKLTKRPTEDFSELNTPPNLNYKCIAVSRPLDEYPSSGITSSEFQPFPTFDLHESNEAIKVENVTPSHKKIGFIGLGMMGQRLLKNLLTSNHKVTVWNRTPEKCEEFAKVGAELAHTPSDVVENSDIIFCCVSGPEASKSLVFGNCGILSGLEKSPPGSKSYVEMTTLDPTTSINIHEAITSKGGNYLEAAICGSRKPVEDGILLILCAGDKNVFVSCDSCFFTLSKNVYYLGAYVCFASQMNLILSTRVVESPAALLEALDLVERCNLSEASFFEIMEPICSPLLIEKGEAILSRIFKTNTALKYQQRDIISALTFYIDRGHPMSVTTAANEVFERAKLRNYSDRDVSAVYMGTEY
ncbi:cytokine-like nuclear factor N-PAC [Argiope bruennichi]|uniref:cytokine-like nuclear factor N-PAC n=1 Tax=Argiope bruennichi TaxID=94029 RepID=UPI0024949B5D|nr:cytokine-like nuclear factor N-PAC [Argiope bruennichi]XP_055929945.1 cytokine-like nuclear factor N-PAC [Argiope bruennichi]